MLCDENFCSIAEAAVLKDLESVKKVGPNRSENNKSKIH